MAHTDEKLLVKLSIMYFEEGLTQAEIAKQLGVSRSLISKLLLEARERGIVEFFVNSESAYTTGLERKLEKKYGLVQANVLDTFDLEQKEIEKRVAQKAALEYSKLCIGKTCLGISWGTSLKNFIDYFPNMTQSNTKVVPLIGGMSSDFVDLHSNQLSYKLARKLKGEPKFLYAPALINNQFIKAELLHNPVVKNIMEEMSEVEIAFLGLSTIDEKSTMKKIGYIEDEEFEELYKQDAIGDINSRFFDKEGKELVHPINQNVIGMNIENLKKIPYRATIIDNEYKYPAVEIALSKGLINIVTLTDTMAEKLIKS